MSKRARTAGGGLGGVPSSARDPRRIAIAIAARTRARFPYANYGTAHYRRGSADSLNMFGPTFRGASAPQQALRRSTGFVGRGRYGAGSFVKDMRTLGLNKYTSQLGDIGVGAARDLVNYGVRKFTGRGAYGSNVGVGTNDLFSSDDKDDIIISHSEFLTTITPTSSSFETPYSAVINPGLQSFAPMLAQIAQYYEEYEMLQLVFEFKSTVVDGNDNAAGTVMMATQYNPTNTIFASDAALDNYAHSCAGKVTDSLLHGVECQERATGQARFEYVRTGAVPAGQDPKSYDLAVFQISTLGAFANLQIGRLYAHYKVRLSKLKLLPSVPLISNGIPFANLTWTGTTITASALFGNVATTSAFTNNLGIYAGSNIINFAQGRQAVIGAVYLITFNMILSAAAVQDLHSAMITNPVLDDCVIVEDSVLPASKWFAAVSGTVSSTKHAITFAVRITGNFPSYQHAALTALTTNAANSSQLTVTLTDSTAEFGNAL